ncbi:hypothetical protein A7982_12668 [Minicystis rosea]|nr:hypothetical protein A7982_12668 [Minicystis rosea]
MEHADSPMPPKSPSKKPAQKPLREDLLAKQKQAPLPADPLSPEALRPMALRIGLPVLAGWILAFVLSGWIPKAVMGVITLALAAVLLWALRFARRSRAVASIVREVGDTPEARKEAIAKLESEFKKDDTAAVFAKAQLLMQEDPRAALAALETINLDKALAPEADQARAQRAMIHLMLGETDQARQLVDVIDMSRHKEPQTRATMASITGEAWARTGQAKKAVELLETLDVEDAVYADLKPQLLRSRAFAYAWASDTKQMKHTLRKLFAINPQYLFGFITKKKNPMGVNPRGVHPLLEKEAAEMLSRATGMPRRMEIKRG